MKLKDLLIEEYKTKYLEFIQILATKNELRRQLLELEATEWEVRGELNALENLLKNRGVDLGQLQEEIEKEVERGDNNEELRESE